MFAARRSALSLSHAGAVPPGRCSQNAVAEMYDAVSESVLVEELKVGAGAGWQCGIAPTQNDWP
ncbi:MAG: hypothetical protein QOD57_4008, partial [Actinomycetota bacterium]|nr:hypothetical protein [Actinomycetota bacterium]